MMKPHLIRLGLILSICVLALAAEAGMAEAATLRYREVLRLWIAENEAQAWTPDSGPTPTPIPRDVQTDLNPTLSFSWSADGQRLAVGYRDAVRIWDTVTGKVIRRIAHPGGTLPPDDPYTFPDPNAVDVAWSPDGQWLAVSVQGKVLIRDAESGNEIQDCGRLGDSTNLTWSADSKRLAGGVLNTPYANSSIHFCEVGSDTVPAIERVNYASVLAYSPNGQKLAAISDSYDFTPYVRIYDAVTLQLDATLQGHYALAWSPDGEKLATIGYEIQIRDAQSYLPLITIPNEAVVLAWHPKANRLIAGDFDGDLKVYDTESGALLTTIRNTAFGWHFLNGLGLPGAVKWSPEGARFAMQAGGFIRVYTESGGASAMTRPTARSGTPTLTPISATLTPHMAKLSTANPGRLHEITRAWRRMEGEVNPYYWSPDGSVGVMVVASEDLGEVWELSKVGDPESRLMIRLDNPTGWAFSPNGRFFAVASYYEDARGKPAHKAPLDARILHIWPVDANLNLGVIPDNDTVASMAWSPDGKWIAVIGANRRFSLWNAALQERVFSVEHPSSELNRLAWSPDSRALALTGPYHLTILSIDPSGRRAPGQWSLANYTSFDVSGIAFAPDGTKIAVSTDEGLVRVWDMQTHQLIDTVKGHQSRVLGLAWSPDNRLLASLSFDYSIDILPNLIVQDMLAHKAIANLSGLAPLGLKMGWGSQGTNLIISEMDGGGRIQVLDTKTGDLTTWDQGPLPAVSLSADGHWLAYAFRVDDNAADASIHIVDTTTGLIAALLPSPVGVYYLEWSPDARHLVSIDVDDRVTLWGDE